MNTLRERLAHARKESGLTQKQLADRAKVTQQLISRLESGEVSSTKKLVDIASALKVQAEWLNGSEEKIVYEKPEKIDISKMIYSIGDEFSYSEATIREEAANLMKRYLLDPQKNRKIVPAITHLIH